MSNVKNTEKRARATNFNFCEKKLLLNIALENRHILENKESNAVSRKDKNKCWLNIVETYNSTTTGCVRISNLIFRIKYDYLYYTIFVIAKRFQQFTFEI